MLEPERLLRWVVGLRRAVYEPDGSVRQTVGYRSVEWDSIVTVVDDRPGQLVKLAVLESPEPAERCVTYRWAAAGHGTSLHVDVAVTIDRFPVRAVKSAVNAEHKALVRSLHVLSRRVAGRRVGIGLLDVRHSPQVL